MSAGLSDSLHCDDILVRVARQVFSRCRPPEMAEHVASVLLRPSAGFRQVRDEDLRVEVGADLPSKSGAQVGQGGALAVL